MGGFYGSVQVKGVARDAVKAAAAEVARGQGIKCLVGPALGGWVGIYPENNGQDQSVAGQIARNVGGTVLHLIVHDDGIFAYWLWRDGKAADAYWSRPGYFGDTGRAEQEAMAGRPESLAHLAGGRVDELRDLLRRDGTERVFESNRMADFAALLGIANAVTAYEYLKAGETDDVSGWDQFEEVPEDVVAGEQAAERERRARVELRKAALRRAGALLVDVEREDATPQVCAAGDGFLVTWVGGGRAADETVWYRPPWDGPRPVEGAGQGRVLAGVSDAHGRRVAFAAAHLVTVWDVEGSRPLLERFYLGGARVAAMNADGGRVLIADGDYSVALVDAETGDRQASFEAGGNGRFAIHPSGGWVAAAATLGRLDVFDAADGKRTKALYVGGAMDLTAFFADLRGQVAEADLPQQVPPRGNETVMCLGLSRDGRWLWCGTDKGLRVYEWPAVLAAAGDGMPPPAWAHDAARENEFGVRYGLVYAAAGEPDGRGVVFGGYAGKVFRMDLATGDVWEVLSPPEDAAIVGLALSRDGRALGVVTRPWLVSRQRVPGDVRATWQVWAYPVPSA